MSETPQAGGPPPLPGQPIGGTGPGVWDPDFFQNPFPVYSWLRDNDPVRGITWPGPPGRAWLVTRYEDVHQGQADSRLRHDLNPFMAQMGIPEPPAIGGDVARLLGRNLTLLDAPDHPRLRSVMARFFTKKRIEGIRPRVEALTDSLLDDLAERAGGGPVDLVRDFAWKLPLAVVCELLGVPEEDHELFGYGTDASRDQGATGAYAAGAVIAVERLRALIGEKRARPGDDAFTAFVGPGLRQVPGRGRGDRAGHAVRGGRPRDHRRPARQRRARPAVRTGPAQAAHRRPLAGLQRGRGGAALLPADRHRHSAVHGRARHLRGRHGGPERDRHPVPGLRQPGPGPVPRPGPLRHHPEHRGAPGVRPRRALLRRRDGRPDRGPCRLRPDLRPLPGDAPRRGPRERPLEVQPGGARPDRPPRGPGRARPGARP